MAVWERGKQTPQFTALAYVDDQLIGRYDRDAHQCVPQSSWIQEISRDNADFWVKSTGWDFGSNVVMDLMILKDLYNQSRGIHTLQVITGCELSGDNRTPRGFAQYGFNGRDFLHLDFATLTWTAMDAEAKPVKRKWDSEQHRGKLLQHFLAGTCVEWLHTHLRYGKEALLKIEPPTVRITHKTGSDDLGTLVCHLYGFYPKEIDVTWRKDGEVYHQDTFRGGVVPNSDGSYNTWLSVEVDLKERNRYWCRVEHNGLPEPLILAWEEPASVARVRLIVGVVLGAVAGLALVGAVIIYIKKTSRKPLPGGSE
ncbi:HLA class I histocompatibility antigen, A alpha chain-like [Heteronotia binoei]|uniref:HLA class I histocompatibility antigen, A alpha chain-like n=1 Tax=Heteronotia binoei TaxID=13085 RepID=UPI0029304B10|nr:HLA class I histocompatibility antigen, A alpha chain-like [Heteronotia binoei]